jgi:hypothetical protein
MHLLATFLEEGRDAGEILETCERKVVHKCRSVVRVLVTFLEVQNIPQLRHIELLGIFEAQRKRVFLCQVLKILLSKVVGELLQVGNLMVDELIHGRKFTSSRPVLPEPHQAEELDVTFQESRVADSVDQRQLQMTFLNVVFQRKQVNRATPWLQSSVDLREKKVVIVHVLQNVVRDDGVEIFLREGPFFSVQAANNPLFPGSGGELFAQIAYGPTGKGKARVDAVIDNVKAVDFDGALRMEFAKTLPYECDELAIAASDLQESNAAR